jgi:hypothetical protein
MECGDDGCGTSCGNCGTGKTCNATTYKCDSCTPEDTAAFCARMKTAGKTCGSITDKDNCSQLPRTEDCGDAVCTAAAKACQNNVCVTPGGPANDTCASPTALTFTNDVATVTDDNTTANADYQGTCSSSTLGKDLVYSFTITGADPRQVTAKVTAGGTYGIEPVVFIETTCGDNATQKACAVGSSDATAVVNSLPPGTYFIIDDSDYSSSVGSFTLEVTLGTPPKPPANDTCATGQAITQFTHNATNNTDQALVPGTTVAGTDDYQGTCSTALAPQNGADVVYQFNIAAGADRSATISVTRDPTATSYLPTVYLRSNCTSPAAADEKGCAGAKSGGSTALTLSRLAPGDYFIVVDGESNSEGAFQLSLTLGDAYDVPDNCTSPAQAIKLDANGHGTVDGDTSVAKNDITAGCESTPGNDEVYVVDTSGLGTRTLVATVSYVDTGASATVSIRSTCDDVSTELGCSHPYSTPATATAGNAAEGKYYIWVGELKGDEGPFTLTIDASLPPPNDTCATAAQVNLDASGHGTANGDTILAADDVTGSCAYSSGGDLAYFVDTTGLGERNLTAVVTFVNTSASAQIFILKACTGAGNELACNEPYNNVATATATRVPEGKYIIFVDSSSGDEGPFSLDVTAAVPPAPVPGDYCDAAGVGSLPIILDAVGHGSAKGDTSLATSGDAKGSCETTSGKDLVYMVETTGLGERNLTAVVAFDDTNASASVYIRKVCNSSDPADELACDHPVNYQATAVAKKLPEGKYYVWVDEYAGDEGSFTLTVDAVTPPPSPCPTATVVDVSTGTGTVTGSTTTGANYTQGTCGGDQSNDVVYSFTTTAAQKATITVTPAGTTPDYIPLLYVRKVCDSEVATDELGCDAPYSAGDVASVVVKNLPVGTYAVWVDGNADYYTGPTNGDFTLDIKLEAPVLPPTNDVCGAANANVIALTQAVTASGDTSDAIADYGNPLSAVCHTAASGDAKGKDVVYSYTPAADGDFTVTVTPTGWDTLVWANTGTCGDATACLWAVDKGYSGTAEALTVPGVTGTTYFIYVDAYSAYSSGGPFTIVVQ